MDKVVVMLLLILAAFSLYLSFSAREAKQMQQTIRQQAEQIRSLKQSAASDSERVQSAEQRLEECMGELARARAGEVELKDQLDRAKDMEVDAQQMAQQIERLEQLVESHAERQKAAQDELQGSQKELKEAVARRVELQHELELLRRQLKIAESAQPQPP